VKDLDEESLCDTLPLVMVRFAIAALQVNVRGCLSRQDWAHCLAKTPLDDATYRAYVQHVPSGDPA
jgi:hypothetical protein